MGGMWFILSTSEEHAVSFLASLHLEEFEKECSGQLDCLKPHLQELVEELTK